MLKNLFILLIMRERLANSLFWLVWSRGGMQLISFVTTIFVARLLEPKDYGLMAIASVLITTIAILAELGLGAAIIQFRDLTTEELNFCFWLTMGLAACTYGLLFFSAPSIAEWFASAELGLVLQVTGIALLLIAVKVVPDSLLRKRLFLDKISQAEIIASLFTIPVVLGLALMEFGVWALIAGMLTKYSVQALMIFGFLHWWPGMRMWSQRLYTILVFSLNTLGSRLLFSVYGQADVFIVGKVTGEAMVGFYSMAKELALLPVTKISAVVKQVANPVMAELQSDRKAMATALLKGIGLIATITLPLSIGFVVVADDIVHAVLTEKWLPCVPVLQVLCFYAAIRSIDNLLPPVLKALYQTRELFVYSVILLLVMVPAFWIGARWYGGMGTALMWLIVYPFLLSWLGYKVFKGVGIALTDLYAYLRVPILSTFGMVVVVLAFQWMMNYLEGEWVLWSRLLLSVGIGGIVYLALTFIMRGPLYEELFQIAGWLIRRKPAAPLTGA